MHRLFRTQYQHTPGLFTVPAPSLSINGATISTFPEAAAKVQLKMLLQGQNVHLHLHARPGSTVITVLMCRLRFFGGIVLQTQAEELELVHVNPHAFPFKILSVAAAFQAPGSLF